MEKLEERIFAIYQSTAPAHYKIMAEEVRKIAIEFANYILNEQAMKDMSGRYLIAGVGVFTPDELFNRFLEEKYK